ncbi:Phenylalanine--tRNA ligase alpha subunit [Frankliniella fusca]|uniref:Phenylalanine--tRNA ligase alpha subunit n=1 Tax=Frankliniella fusca TaxID=407009 RepID=A0AAE1L7J7_9NEOP|nr:Phenylalanine--tRNA ligase alpha subunit [Frankliniella fusca]
MCLCTVPNDRCRKDISSDPNPTNSGEQHAAVSYMASEEHILNGFLAKGLNEHYWGSDFGTGNASHPVITTATLFQVIFFFLNFKVEEGYNSHCPVPDDFDSVRSKNFPPLHVIDHFNPKLTQLLEGENHEGCEFECQRKHQDGRV